MFKNGILSSVVILITSDSMDHGPYSYCDQPFLSETTRCVSNDFIENNDNPGQNVVPFYVERIERERANYQRDRERECV
jgi:hypothetical protein